MKLNKKKVFVVALAVCLIAVLSLGTLAWFNATDDITNTFKVTTDENNTDPEFSVDVSETDPETGAKDDDGVTYWNVLPGDVIGKDPKVTNTGDYTQWIRVTVTLANAAHWEQHGGSLAFTDLFSGSDYDLVANLGNTNAKWLLVEDAVTADATTGDAVWYLYLNREFPAGSDELVFTEVHVPEDFDQNEVADMGNEFSVKVSADAVQRDNTGDNAVEAFRTVNWPAGTAFADVD